KLRGEVRKRGLSDFGVLERDAWETLDREELLTPVAYARHGMWHYDQPACLNDGDLVVREEIGYRPWAELRAESESIHGDDANPQILYHHWQLFWLGELQDRLSPSVLWGQLGDGLKEFYEVHAKVASAPDPLPLEELRQAATGWQAIELLLARVQNVFFPFERGGPRQSRWTGSGITGLTDDAAEWAMEQLRTLDYRALAEDCGVEATDLAATYEQLASAGLRIDPTAALFGLLDQVNRPSRERLSGHARLALDYYDASRMIRQWHQRLGSADPLPDIDELQGAYGTRLKEKRYGTLDIRGNRAVLPIVLEEYGLYPWRVQLIGEGDSEIAALRVILDQGYGLTFETLGIAVTDMGGADIPAKAERLLAAFRGYANYFLLVFDNEGKARELIEELLRADVIEGVSDDQRKAIREEAAQAARQLDEPDARRAALRAALDRANDLSQEPGAAPEFVLWKENFEVDNFTTAELCQVVVDFAAETQLERFALDVSEVEASREQASRNQDEEKGIASVILTIAEKKNAGFRLSKPDFARRLAQFALTNPELDGKRRPILDLAEHLVQLTWADRRLAGVLRG
ncbi:MAG TPA: hypothetical protein VFM94_01535, partial [Solirubrobacterales bacterium]|nr:hypothetical protein [Solirubrobacterales bacterium]